MVGISSCCTDDGEPMFRKGSGRGYDEIYALAEVHGITRLHAGRHTKDRPRVSFFGRQRPRLDIEAVWDFHGRSPKIRDETCVALLTGAEVAEAVLETLGFSGHGAQLAPHMGVVMADAILGRANANPLDGLDWPAVPGHFGRAWFLPLVGMYYKALDRWR